MQSGCELDSAPVPAEALKAMEKVASHINEMQKIYEDYGSVFDQLVAEQTGHDKEVGTHLIIQYLITKHGQYISSCHVDIGFTGHLLQCAKY